jgi:hypothetical protein
MKLQRTTISQQRTARLGALGRSARIAGLVRATSGSLKSICSYSFMPASAHPSPEFGNWESDRRYTGRVT